MLVLLNDCARVQCHNWPYQWWIIKASFLFLWIVKHKNKTHKQTRMIIVVKTWDTILDNSGTMKKYHMFRGLNKRKLFFSYFLRPRFWLVSLEVSSIWMQITTFTCYHTWGRHLILFFCLNSDLIKFGLVLYSKLYPRSNQKPLLPMPLIPLKSKWK